MKYFLWILLLLAISYSAGAQDLFLPMEGSALNYRIVGFSFQEVGPAVVQIAACACTTEDSFKAHLISTTPVFNNGTAVAEVPQFGAAYTWRHVDVDRMAHVGGATPTWEHIDTMPGKMHHFTVKKVPDMDTANFRMRVVQRSKEYKDAFFFCDGPRALYNMEGQPVWFLPDTLGFRDQSKELRDLKMTPQGTITFLLVDKAYEIDYNGHVLWTAPNNGSVSSAKTENYHHAFTRMQNGHYMILGNEPMLARKSFNDDGGRLSIVHPDHAMADSTTMFKSVLFGSIIEYDRDKKVVWSWKSSDYFSKSDLLNRRNRKNVPDFDTHQNSFFFDEKDSIIYMGFRNISRILKIKYPSGKVLDSYGETYKPNEPEKGNGIFCRQHDCRRSAEGYLYLYDNNLCSYNQMPKLMMLQEPETRDGALKTVWEYTCTTEGATPGTGENGYQFPIGGSVEELPDGNLFANMSGSYTKVFIVNRKKKILWSAIPERWNAAEKKWQMAYQYRASIINNRKDMVRLVWAQP